MVGPRRSRHRVHFSQRYRLSEADAAVVAALADEYRAFMVTSDAICAPIVKSRAPHVAADLQVIADEGRRRDAEVTSLVARLKSGLGADGTARIWQRLAKLVAENPHYSTLSCPAPSATESAFLTCVGSSTQTACSAPIGSYSVSTTIPVNVGSGSQKVICGGDSKPEPYCLSTRHW